MKTIEVVIGDVPFVLTEKILKEWPSIVPDCCGAGKGLGEAIVPDSWFGIDLSEACWIHDRMWEEAELTWEDFHQSNSIFMHNLLSIFKHKGDNCIVADKLGDDIAMAYFKAVDTAGIVFFAKGKIK